MRLVIKWRKFKNQLELYLNEVDCLLDLKNGGENRYDVELFLKISNNWIKSCHVFLKYSFDNANNKYAQSFLNSKSYKSYSKNGSNDLADQIDTVFKDIEAKRKDLRYILRILSVSDIIIEPNLVDKQIRASYANFEFADLILDKLYHLYDKYYYPIETILEGNGIALSMFNDIAKIVENLKEKGYLETIGKRILAGKLTLKGYKYIKSKRQFNLIDTIYLVKEEPNINISEFAVFSNKTELGKMMLVKELNDKQSLYNKLNRKSWSELLKGKLNDLETTKAINKETVRTIYQSMMNDDVEFI